MFAHKPVLYQETIEALRIRPDGIYVDGKFRVDSDFTVKGNRIINGDVSKESNVYIVEGRSITFNTSVPADDDPSVGITMAASKGTFATH